MGLDLLDNPIRVTWDLQGPGYAMAEADAGTVLQRLLDAQVFFVTLELNPLNHPLCSEILSGLTDAGVQVLLLCDGSEKELPKLSLIENLPVSLIVRLEPFLSTRGVDYNRLRQAVQTCRRYGVNPGLSMTPLKSNIALLSPLLEFCKELKIPRFKLPNLRIDDNFFLTNRAQVLRPGDLESLKQKYSEQPLSKGGIDLEIHDLFLWEILTPQSESARSEYGGCQAGNSLAHVSSDGSVLPCVTWPVPLGSLLEQSFAEIWMTDKRQAIRGQVAKQPAGCTDCRDYQLCFGGCRGLSDVLAVEEGLDPMCKGSR